MPIMNNCADMSKNQVTSEHTLSEASSLKPIVMNSHRLYFISLTSVPKVPASFVISQIH
jgi:hypothetical protein